jgi:hypothetical protein
MALESLRAFLRTKEPYRTDFSVRTLLHFSPALARAHKAWLRRPWLRSAGSERRISGLKPGCRIGAVPHYRTGIGHTLAEWNTGLLWSMKLGIEFAHCPVREPWDAFLGLTGFDQFQELKENGLPVVRLPLIPYQEDPAESPLLSNIINHYGRDRPTLFQLHFEQNAFRHDETSEILREKYFARRVRDPVPDVRVSGKINVSIHMRRRNKEDMTNPLVHDPNSPDYKARYLPADYFVNTCRTIESVFGREKVTFNVFSQGTPDDFADLQCLGQVRFFLDEDVLRTFHNILMGDILVLSPSSYSFKAGMISRGYKIAPHPWWHYIPESAEWCRGSVECQGDDSNVRSFLEKAVIQ